MIVPLASSRRHCPLWSKYRKPVVTRNQNPPDVLAVPCRAHKTHGKSGMRFACTLGKGKTNELRHDSSHSEGSERLKVESGSAGHIQPHSEIGGAGLGPCRRHR